MSGPPNARQSNSQVTVTPTKPITHPADRWFRVRVNRPCPNGLGLIELTTISLAMRSTEVFLTVPRLAISRTPVTPLSGTPLVGSPMFPKRVPRISP